LEDRVDPFRQSVITADLRKPITLLVLLNAGLLVAANILILVSERKKEIAVLKAMGGRESELIRMILAEALLVSGVGASMGFFFIRIQAVLNQLTNPLGLFVILGLFLRDFFFVLGVTLLSAMLFGWIPAKKYASLPVMEVLRNE
jgi:lipoprotein-releasing system permease protein